MTYRARLKRQARERARWVYLVGVRRRVRRGSVVVFAITHPSAGRRPLAFGWVKADRADPVVHWGHPRV